MKDKWIIVTQSCGGLYAKAVNTVSAALYAQTGYVIPVLYAEAVTEEQLSENNVILIGTRELPQLDALITAGHITSPEKPQSYAAVLTQSVYSAEHQMLILCGYDEAGVLYAAVDFEMHYIGYEMYNRYDCPIVNAPFFNLPFRSKMPVWLHSAAPAIAKRGIWTWGHCIYDYRRFFDNMLALKLNQIVIWNDCVPINAKEIVAYAHACGIEVYWGFSWGWDNRAVDFRVTDERVLCDWADRIFRTYENDYAPTGADGIYFQSFTETANDTVDGVLIADVVVKWVNFIGGKLLSAYPALEIQFGLHATSVRTHLDSIAKTDPRIRIVWEDCGAFPYAYDPRKVGGFDETLALHRTLCTLRGENEKFGAVLKGMTTLDWSNFEHQCGSYVMGECAPEFIKARSTQKERLWRVLQHDWIAHLSYAQKLVADTRDITGGDTTVQWLIEDGCFEESIFYPAALAAELLWDADSDSRILCAVVASHPRVKFAYL